MILLWGIETDGPLAAVRAALEARKAPALFLNQQEVLESKIELGFEKVLRGTLKTRHWRTTLDSVSAVYLRPYDTRRMAAVESLKPGDTRLRQALSFDDAVNGWAELSPALVINRPSAMTSNNSKPYQLELIRAAGFDVPDTLVTTDPSAAAEFWERHGAVIYKSVSGVRSIVSRLREEHRDRLARVAHCPTQFQEYVEGSDFRVHVIGEEIFGCEVASAADDYRYPSRQGAGLRVREAEIPAEVAQRCLRLTASLGLVVSGIDLRRSPEGRWVCFEANPSPGFSFYEESTGQPIARAIAGLLAGAAA